jgi:hypothetical protein
MGCGEYHPVHLVLEPQRYRFPNIESQQLDFF